MPPLSWQTVLVAAIAAVVTATGSIIVALITKSKHPIDVSSSLMNEALDLVESLRAERTELRTELASLRTEVVKCREEIAELREENQKLRLALGAYGGTIDEESTRTPTHVVVDTPPTEENLHPRRAAHRHQRPQRNK